jgi:crotonobetaine/carnitine-CoA ligase
VIDQSSSTGLALPEVLERAAVNHPDAPTLRWRDGPPVTAAQLLSRAQRIARGLARLGVGRGDPVLLMLPNGLDIIAAWLGASLLGAVEVPVNIHDRGSFLAHVVSDSRASVIICDPGYVRHLAAIAAECADLRTVITAGAQGPDHVPFGWGHLSRWEHRSLGDVEGSAGRFPRADLARARPGRPRGS